MVNYMPCMVVSLACLYQALRVLLQACVHVNMGPAPNARWMAPVLLMLWIALAALVFIVAAKRSPNRERELGLDRRETG